MLKNLITQDLKKLRQCFVNSGFDVRFVGGCVRDSILGITPKDIDLCTDARPEEQIEIYKNNGYRWIETGLQHGTVTVVINTVAYEITSLRIDVETDGRHARVDYTRDWQRDLARRDFTINSMSYTFDGELIDPFNGHDHLKNNLVTFVGDAEERIKEDYLRILRWFRFNARFGPNNLINRITTFKEYDSEIIAIAKNAQGLKNITSERIWSEYSRIISADHTGYWTSLMSNLGINPHIGLTFYGNVNYKDSEFFKTLKHTQDSVLLMGAITDWQYWEIDAISRKWKWSNEETRRALWFCSHIHINQDLRRAIAFEDVPREWVQLLALIEGRDEFECYAVANWNIEPFPVNGNDLIEIGFKPSPIIGQKLKELKEIWAENGYTQSKSELLKYI